MLHKGDGRKHITRLVITFHNCFLSAVKNVKLLLCLVQHHDMKAYEEVEIYFHAFLTTLLDGATASPPSRSLHYPSIRKLGRPLSVSGRPGFLPFQESNHVFSVVQSVVCH
jgi:hypothetical protein